MTSPATPSSRAVWALVEDLFFRAKIEALCAATGRGVAVYRDAASLVAALGAAGGGGSNRPAAIVVELGGRADQGNALLEALLALPDAPPTLGFYSHVEDMLRRRALELGATQVVPRSAFVKRFDALLEGLSERKTAAE